MPGETVRRAEVRVLRPYPERWVAPEPAQEVRRAQGDERHRALFMDQMEHRLAVGLDAREQPVYVDFDYINGRKGGHVNVSGISGVATKTTSLLALLYLLFETPDGRRLLGRHVEQTRALVLSVKNEDLLHIDRPNRRLEEDAPATLGDPWCGGPGRVHRCRVLCSAPARLRECGAPDRDSDPARRRVGIRLDPARVRLPGTAGVHLGRCRRRPEPAQFRRTAGSGRAAALGLAGSGSCPARWSCVIRTTTRHVPSSVPSATSPGRDPIPARPRWHPDLGFRRARRLHRRRDSTTTTRTSLALTLLRPSRPSPGGSPPWPPGWGISSDWASRHPSSPIRSRSSISMHCTTPAQRFVVGALVNRIFEQKQATGREPLRLIMLDELDQILSGPRPEPAA